MSNSCSLKGGAVSCKFSLLCIKKFIIYDLTIGDNQQYLGEEHYKPVSSNPQHFCNYNIVIVKDCINVLIKDYFVLI